MASRKVVVWAVVDTMYEPNPIPVYASANYSEAVGYAMERNSSVRLARFLVHPCEGGGGKHEKDCIDSREHAIDECDAALTHIARIESWGHETPTDKATERDRYCAKMARIYVEGLRLQLSEGSLPEKPRGRKR